MFAPPTRLPSLVRLISTLIRVWVRRMRALLAIVIIVALHILAASFRHARMDLAFQLEHAAPSNFRCGAEIRKLCFVCARTNTRHNSLLLHID